MANEQKIEKGPKHTGPQQSQQPPAPSKSKEEDYSMPTQASFPPENSSVSKLKKVATDSEPDGLVGQIVAGRYQVLQKIGEGGMGAVYLAQHIAIEKKIALKVLQHAYARKEDLKERFLQEAKAAAKIGHENIVDITDFGDTPDGSVFFAMEYMDGEDLSQVIRRTGPMPWERAKPIILQVCRALGAAHSNDIIHRDMKPENIFLIEREGRKDFVKVLDFGIAKVMGLSDEGRKLTRTGMIFGTPEYMSPEQAQGHTPDHRVDVYAVGVILYEMLTGDVPFKADTFMGILTKHIFEKPKPPSVANPKVSIPNEVEAIVLKALSKDKNERFRSMAEMGAAIVQASGRITRPTGDNPPVQRILQPAISKQSSPSYSSAKSSTDETSTTNLIETIPSNKRTLVAILFAVVLLLGGGFGVWGIFFNKSSSSDSEQISHSNAKLDAQPINAVAQIAVAKTPSIESSVKTVQITITSNPTGAEISMGEKLLGTTPETITLPQSTNQTMLKLTKEGYQIAQIEFVPNQDRKIDKKLLKFQGRAWTKHTASTPSKVESTEVSSPSTVEPTKAPQPPVEPIKTPPAMVEITKVEPEKAPPPKVEITKVEPPKTHTKKAPAQKTTTTPIGDKVPELRDPFED